MSFTALLTPPQPPTTLVFTSLRTGPSRPRDLTMNLPTYRLCTTTRMRSSVFECPFPDVLELMLVVARKVGLRPTSWPERY